LESLLIYIILGLQMSVGLGKSHRTYISNKFSGTDDAVCPGSTF
jgi:hypothetical protein